MRQTVSQSLAVLVGCSTLVASGGGCGTTSTPEAGLLNMLDQVLHPTTLTTAAAAQSEQAG